MVENVLAVIPQTTTITSWVALSPIKAGEGKSVVGVVPDSKVTFPDSLMTGTNKLRQIVFRKGVGGNSDNEWIRDLMGIWCFR